MAHKLEIRGHGDGGRVVAGPDIEVTLDGRPLEWIEVELVLKPENFVTVRLTLTLSDLVVDADVLVALRALADGRTKVEAAESNVCVGPDSSAWCPVHGRDCPA